MAEKLDLGLLRARIGASEAELLGILLKEQGWIDRKDLTHLIPAPQAVIEEAVSAAVERQEAVSLSSYLVARAAWERLKEKIVEYLRAFHRQYPLRSGLPRETLRSHLGVDWRFFDELIQALAEEKVLASEGANPAVRPPGRAFRPGGRAGTKAGLAAQRKSLCPAGPR